LVYFKLETFLEVGPGGKRTGPGPDSKGLKRGSGLETGMDEGLIKIDPMPLPDFRISDKCKKWLTFFKNRLKLNIYLKIKAL
jgi:hypothetical protein